MSTKPANKEQLLAAKKSIMENLDKVPSNPILVRLAWHDSGTYNKDIPVSEWPKCGGANGSIRFDPEIGHGANAGLNAAVKLLDKVKSDNPDVSWADLLQLASACAVEHAGGPKIDMQYGRVEVDGPEGCSVEGLLPDGDAPFGDGAKTPGEHLRNVFHRMGFTDQEITALSGAHTLGRAFKSRSGAARKDPTKYTESVPPGVTKGGQSWTAEWLKFDNSYFKDIKAQADDELLVLQTDDALFKDEGFKSHALRYAEDEQAFFKEYAAAHKKLSELGVKWAEGAPIKID